MQIPRCVPGSLKPERAFVTAMFVVVALGVAGCAREPGSLGARPVATHTGTAPSPAPRPVKPSPAPVIVPANLGRSSPVRLRIASIGVDTGLMPLGLRANGAMQVPPGGFPAGWYTGGPTPGELGPAVIAGHVDTNGPGVFYRLRNIRRGDRVTVTRADGRKPVFRVTRVAQFPKNRFPSKLVYGNVDHAALRLITCGGSFNSRVGHYEDNLVVFADLVTPAP
ncbi:MAG: hypothetical protein QOF35_1271 [Actinomycetota bacterium]|nr:hypothetical protein [Actinomycetota bacterium]